jgi:DNA replication protein DnaC
MVIKPQRIYRDCRGIKDGEEEQAAIDSFVNIPFLVIDDLGVDKKTDFSFSTLYEVIDGRDMSEMKGLIVTSNLSLSALAERLGDDRISSRLAGMCKIVEITGKDRRTNEH